MDIKLVLLTLSARSGHRGSDESRLEKTLSLNFELLLSDVFDLDFVQYPREVKLFSI